MRKHGGFFVSDVATIAVSAPLKRQSTAALQNVAVILALIFSSCVLEGGGAPPLSDAAGALFDLLNRPLSKFDRNHLIR